MKKYLVIAPVVVLLALFAARSVDGGDYHVGATLFCNQCHTMHFSQQHGYNPDGSGVFTPLATSGGPFDHLLRNEQNALCLTCHDGSGFAPDVLGDNTGKSPTDVRQAGALNKDDGSVANYPKQAGHSLYATGTPPGGTWTPPTGGMVCGNCHGVHGANPQNISSYRNLGGYGTQWVAYGPTGTKYLSYATGAQDSTKDVFQRESLKYDISKVDFNEPDNTQSKYAQFCQACHTNFHGTVGSTEIGGNTATGHFLRHPTAGVDIGAIGGGHSSLTRYAGLANKVKVMSETGVWDGTVGDITPSCFSCHKGHGNKNAFGLIYMRGTGTVTEQGDDGNAVRDLCRQCHVQGG